MDENKQKNTNNINDEVNTNSENNQADIGALKQAIDALNSPKNEDDKTTLIEKLQVEIAEKNDAFVRAKAEGENIRKRAVEERIRAQKFAIESFAVDLLPVADALKASLENVDVDIKKIVEGIKLTQKLFESVCSKNNLQMIDCENAKFDPNFHSAIATEDSELEPGIILKVLQNGYKLNERVIRPAMVIVAKKKES